MTTELVFYTNPLSRGQIVRWMLEEVGEPYEQVLLDYGTTMRGAAYLALNPMGKVPAISHRGQMITEGAAICCYLANAFPAAGLGPTAEEMPHFYRWLFFAAGPFEQAVTNQVAFPSGPSEDRSTMFGFGSFQRTMDTTEAWLRSHDYFCGDRFTAVDVFFGASLSFYQRFNWVPASAVLREYVDRIERRPAYAAAQAIDNALIAEQQS